MLWSSQLRAGRALAGLTIEDLAARAQLHRRSVRKWEGSSNAVPDAMVAHLCHVVDVLEGEDARSERRWSQRITR